ncbi:MAG: CinA family nicotinamide mononucleotide deamidase-related protein [Pseudomonadales bacterium]|nr:CinA family nicotinamide mononucleotide deamidase-related protein [Pseudomonadales bacterium]
MELRLLLTGNELMSGVTVDSNSALIARKLEPLSLQVCAKHTIGDDRDLLCAELERLASASDVLIVNGGLGPTRDDLTAEALAAVCGVPLEESAVALAHLEAWSAQRGYAMNAANRKQAMLPAGAAVIPNAVGSAVGFRVRYRDCEILCTPGVPGELRVMLDREIVPWLGAQFPAADRVVITRLQFFGIGESGLQQLLSEQCPDWPPHIELGFRAGAPTLELKISSLRAADERDRLACEQRVRELFGDYIIGTGDTSLARCVVELLGRAGQRVATAESCTGGLIAAMLTEVPGASAVYEAGVVSYSNRIKQQLLGVEAHTLAEHGAVSEQVVREMARGALALSGAEHVVSVSGVAGPDGGSADKPVGTVWICWGGQGRLRARQLYFPVARKLFQTMVAATALDLLRREILGIEEEPRYFRERVLRR